MKCKFVFLIRALCLTLFFSYVFVAYASSCEEEDLSYLTYHKQAIVDDKIAAAIKSPPPSVSDLLRIIENLDESRRVKVTMLDLSENNICVAGATQILGNVCNSLPNLETLDLSFNRIYDWRGREGFYVFEENLINFLKSEKIRKLIIKVNPIANVTWMRYLKSKLDAACFKKIVWKR